MNELSRILLLLAGGIFTHNVVLTRLFGVEALENGQDDVRRSAILGCATTVVMTVTAAIGWLVGRLLEQIGFAQVQILAIVLVALAATWAVRPLVSKLDGELGKALRDHPVPIAANTAVLGTALVNAQCGCAFGTAVLNGFLGGVGFFLVLVVMAGVRERLETSKVPKAMKGLPIALVSASLIALAFMGFMGLT